MHDILGVRDELVLEPHPDGRYILLRREGETGSIRTYLKEIHYLADGLPQMASGRWRCCAECHLTPLDRLA